MGSLCCKECSEKAPEQKNEVVPLLPVSKKLTKMKWYHGRISNKEADTRIHQYIKAAVSKRESRNGIFLVYTQSGAAGFEQLILLVNYDKVIFRMDIQPSEAHQGLYILGSDGSGLNSYGTVESLIQAAKKQPIRLPNGKKTVLKFSETIEPGSIEYMREINTAELNDKLWYHGDITTQEAKARMYEGGTGINGSYLVYNHPQEYGSYILLVYHEGEILRWKILEIISQGLDDSSEEISYVLGEDSSPGVIKYKAVKELIKAHRGVLGRPIKMDDGRLITLSKSYVCLVK